MRLGTVKLNDDKVLTKRQVAGLLYGAYQMKGSAIRANPWAFDALLLMYLLGLRMGEVVLLRYSHVGKRDVNGAIRSVVVPTEKKIRAGKHLDPMEALYEVPVLAHHAWMAKAFDPRTRVGPRALSEWLFPSPRNPEKHISSRMIDYAFREARDRGGVPEVYSTHALRHTAATEVARSLARRGRGESEVEAWVGKFLRHSEKVDMRGNRVTRTYIHLAPRSMGEWAPFASATVLALPLPLAPCGPSRFVEGKVLEA